MKKLFAVVLFVGAMVIGSAGIAKADTGPYYLYWDGTCHIVKAYLTSDKILYGDEIGCQSSSTPLYGGGYTGPQRASFGYHYNGDPRIIAYDTDGTVSIYTNNGTSLSLFNSGTWSLGGAPLTAASGADPDAN